MLQNKQITIQKALEIINTANPKFSKFYTVENNYIKFWILKNHYCIYQFFLKKQKMLLTLYKNRFLKKFKII